MESPGELERLANSLEEMETEAAANPEADPAPTNLFGSPNSENGFSAGELMDAANAAAESITPNPESQQPTAPRAAKKKSPPGTTTARKGKKSKAQTSIKLGCRVFTTRRSLVCTGILSDIQKEALSDYSQSFKLHATLKSGNTKCGYVVEYDRLPAGHKIVTGVARGRLRVLEAGQDEPEQLATLEEITEAEVEAEAKKAKKKTPLQLSIEDFENQTKVEIATSQLFEMAVTKDEVIDWKILPDGEHITQDDNNNLVPFKCPDALVFKKEIDFINTPLDEIFFDEFFPSVKGHAARMDEFHSSVQSSWHQTVQKEKITFNRPEDDDPDWVVKQCYLLMIAAVTEAETGVDNLWSQGQGKGRHEFPNF